MAVAIVMEFPEGTLEQYDEVLSKMGLPREGPGPPECLFHWVTETDDGIRITDVWVSKEAFDAFAEAKIGPITAEVGVPGPPTISLHEVHNYHTPG